MPSDLVNVAVPREHLIPVYGLLAQLAGKVVTVLAPGADVAPDSSHESSGEWTSALIRKMVEQSDKPMRSVLKALASRPGEWLSSKDLAAAVGKNVMGHDADWNTIAGMFGAFKRRCKNRYRVNTLPFEKRYEHGVGKVFRMSKEIAQQVLQALKNGGKS